MVPLFRTDTEFDPSKKAGDVLAYVLKETDKEADAETVTAKDLQSTIKEELKQAPVLSSVSQRAKSRVLFITEDVSALNEGSTLQNHFKSIVGAFEEVHVIVLTSVYQAKKDTIRLDTNLWLYSTSVRYSFMQIFSGLKVAVDELQFASGFRPDVVVALDPFMSGFVGAEIAQRYKRVFQVHVREDFLSPYTQSSYGRFRIMFGKFVLRHTQSIRASSELIRERLVKVCAHTTDIAVLPKFVDIQSLVASSQKSAPAEDLFPQFSFMILFVGILDHESTLFRALDAARNALFSKGIGMVVLGDGPAKAEFQKRAEILGIQRQVLFKNDRNQLCEYLSSADILLCTDTTEASDEIIVKAVASGLPILAAENHFRNDLFTDGESAFLCPKEDTICFSQKLLKFLNGNALRNQFSVNARDIVTTRLSQDPEVYKEAYRNSIESVFGVV